MEIGCFPGRQGGLIGLVIGDHQSDQPTLAAWEATNLHSVATALVTAAALRTETRGSHWREDYPDSSPDWIGHLVATVDRGTAEETWSASQARTDTQSRPLHNASGGTGVHPDLTEADGLTVRFVPSPTADDGEPSSQTRRASDSDISPQASGTAHLERDGREGGSDG